ncbi:MAG TPA: hypothetical protein PLQ45_09335 [Anaerohalosphaeraceae bacterium]|nr:hypothetical protein [Anaerohalosphaeraceae bacterium]
MEKCDTITFANSVIEGMLEYGVEAVDCRHLSISGNVVRKRPLTTDATKST